MSGEDASARTRIVQSLDEVAADYDVLLCDLWGCYHNGVRPYPAAAAALQRFRAGGGAVVLLTNAPRPTEPIERQLAAMGAPRDSYDDIVSSGAATRHELASGRFGRRIYPVGPERDHGLWSDLPVEPVSLDQAEAILCTGLFDDTTETPDDYAELISAGVTAEIPLLCANPDVVVDRGETRIYCAGAIAEAYTRAGGEVVFFGKPHPPVYALAMRHARALRPSLDPTRVLAIGDGFATDVLGAAQAGLDCLFVSGGLAAAEVGQDPEAPDPALLTQYLVEKNLSPRYTIGRLR